MIVATERLLHSAADLARLREEAAARNKPTGTVLSLIPCISPIGFIGIPFGIWALVVLCDNSVRMAFRR